MKKIVGLFAIAIFGMTGCSKTSSNVLKYDNYYRWNNNSSEFYVDENYFIEITSSKLIEHFSKHEEIYSYKAKGTSLFVARFSDEEIKNNKSSTENKFRYLCEYGDGFLKVDSTNSYDFYITEDFAKEMNLNIVHKEK